MMQLRAITLNIWRYNGDWGERRLKIIDFVRKEKPDLLFLQEVFDDARNNKPGDHQALQLNKELRFKHCVMHVVEQVMTEHNQRVNAPVFNGLGCLTNLDIVHQGFIRLRRRHDDRHYQGIQRIDVRMAGKVVSFFHTHFSNRDDWAKWHLEETFALARQQKEKPIIIGDLNVVGPSILPEVCGSLYDCSYDAKKYISFPSKNETLDYVLIPRKTYRFKEIRCEGDGLSDHKALIAVIESI